MYGFLACMYVCALCACLVPEYARRVDQIPWTWRSKQLLVTMLILTVLEGQSCEGKAKSKMKVTDIGFREEEDSRIWFRFIAHQSFMHLTLFYWKNSRWRIRWYPPVKPTSPTMGLPPSGASLRTLLHKRYCLQFNWSR